MPKLSAPKTTTKATSNTKFRLIAYIIFFLFGALVRVWLASNNNVIFWFDQSRDAIIARNMVLNHDLKVQGPSASGTSDTVYHGVLYYYVVAPLYAIASGNPQIVSMALGVISMLAIIPLGELSWLMFRSRQSFVLTLLLFSLSADASLMGAWLSNPTLALITIPAFFYFLYRVFWLKEADKLWLMALFLGLSNQAIIFTLYLFGVILISWWLQNYFENKQLGQQQENNKLEFNKKNIIKAVAVYLGSVSTIIATQLLLAKRGIFQLQALGQISTTGTSANTVLGGVLNNYLEVLTNNLTPSKPILTLALLLVTIYFVTKKLTKKNQLFFSDCTILSTCSHLVVLP